MNRHICIHGHFYQPPRENPWLEDVEQQDSAYPFHDWNARITSECYEPNSASRILDEKGKIKDIFNNYAKTSFNIGPTLLSWMENNQPELYQSILESDRLSRENFSGHGSAIAQAYNHMIMPLANTRDKRTQVLWGIRDFAYRFGRPPEGMWLPETAVDMESLDIMAELGIKFTLLAPHQAPKMRKIGEKNWQSLDGAKIDPKMPYLCNLASGRTITLFFYDGPVAQEVAFAGLLNEGHRFAERLAETFSEEDTPQLAHIATDGESYGHHHRFGDMALAYCLHHIKKEKLGQITVYGEYLEKYPPTHEAQIVENSSWSCAHGIERWRTDCGCNIGGGPLWNQAWRAPLRKAMDWLRDKLAPLYEKEMESLVQDPWKARDDYIEVILERSEQNVKNFLKRQAGRKLDKEESLKTLRLLEMQRQAMLMYTSCGWFFDEVSGIETTQILGYAGRALQLAEEACGASLEEEYLRLLEKAPSNLPKWKNAANVYNVSVKPTQITLNRVAAHHAIASLFEENHASNQIYCYKATDSSVERLKAGRLKLSMGYTRIHSNITWNEDEFSFAVLHLGSHNLNAGVRTFLGEKQFALMRQEIKSAFERSDVPEVIRLMDRHFGSHNYTLWHLFRDEQRKVLNQVMKDTLEDLENSYHKIYEDHFTLLRFLRDIHMPVPSQLSLPVEVALNSQLRKLIEEQELDLAQIRQLAEDIENAGAHIDETGIGFIASQKINSLMSDFAKAPENMSLLRSLNEILETFNSINVQMNLWKSQNIYFHLHSQIMPPNEESDAAVKPAAKQWLQNFLKLGKHLQIHLD